MNRIGKKTLIICSLLLASACGLFGIGYSSWVAGNGEEVANSATDSFSGTKTEAICINETTNAIYSSLPRALNDARLAATSSNRQIVTIFPGKTITISDQNLLLGSYVTLNIPFIQENGTYICDQQDTSKIGTYGGGRISLLNMRNGYDITIQSNGILNLGGAFTTTGNNGKYCEINLGSNSSITVSGTLNAYGFIRESSSDAIGYFADERENLTNSNDSGRFVSVKSGGTINTFMNIRDAMSGSPLGTVLQRHDLCPFNVWDFNGLQTFVNVEYGGAMNADAVMTISSNVVRRQTGIAGTSNSILLLSSGGSVSLEYCPKNPATLDNTKGNHYTNVVINGSVSLGTLYVDGGSGLYLDTSQCFLPFSYNFNVYVNNGSTATLGHQVKFLPGSYMKVCSGGTLVSTSELIFYQEAHCPASWTYPASCGDATFIVDGTFTCTGKIGALILTESATEDAATLDFSGINSSGNFSVTSIETVAQTEVKIDSKGYFLFGSEISESSFSAQETYSSGDPSVGFYWKGNTVMSYAIEITIAASSYAHPISSYTLSSSDTASGTKSEIVSTDTTYSTTIPAGKYLTVDWLRSAGATITNNGVSVDTTGVTAKTFLPTGRVTILITPNDSVEIHTAYGKNYWQEEYTSGAGGGITTIKESITSGGTYTTVAELSGGAQTGVSYVVKGRYFKVSVTVGSGLSDIDHKYVWRPENFDNKWTTTGRETHNESTAYQSTGNYAFYWEWKVKASCVTPDTLVTMADGSQKPIKYVTQGEMIRVWNHETGQIDIAPVTFNEHDEATMMTVTTLSFSDGTQTEYIYEHGYFDVDLREYVYFTDDNYAEFVGHRFLKVSPAGEQSVVTLTNATQEERWTDCYSLPSYYHLNFFADDFLSMPGGIKGLFNIFELDETFKYDEAKKAADIEKYGLFTREELAALGVDDETYDAYPAAYLKVSIGKGIMAEEDLMYLIERYGKYTQ